MANDDSKLMRVAGFIGTKAAVSERNDNIVNFSIGVQQDYGDDSPVDWFNIAVNREKKPHLADFALDRLSQKANGVYVEGYGKEKEINGKTYRDVWASRIGLIDFVTAVSRPQAEDDGDDY